MLHYEPSWKRAPTSPEARARWLLAFAARDLSTVSDRDWQILQRGAKAFVGGPPRRSVSNYWSAAGANSDILQGWDFLNGIVGTVEAGERWIDGGNAIQGRTFFFEMTPRGLEGGTMPFQNDEWLPMFITAVMDILLKDELGRRFRCCRGCRKLLLARKGQRYCDPRCSQRFRTRKYRTGNRERFNELRRKSYAAKMKKKLGSRVRVGERARQASP